MKIVVPFAPNGFELALTNHCANDFVVKPETYYYFRDEIVIGSLKKYIHEQYPEDVPEMSEGKYRPEGYGELIGDLDGGAAKFAQELDWQKYMSEYYAEWRKKQPKYYAHKKHIYTYKFIGFANVGNEIQLWEYEMEDVVGKLNTLSYQANHPVKKALANLFG